MLPSAPTTTFKLKFEIGLGASFQQYFDEAVRTLRNCVIALWGADEGLPVLIGSAVLLRVSRRAFLVTAHHVMEDNKSINIYYDGGDRLMPLVGNFTHDPEYDVAVHELSDGEVQSLSHYRFLTPLHFRAKPPRPQRTYAAAVGYPASKSRVNGTVVFAEIFSMANLVKEEREGRIFISFNKAKVTAGAGGRRQITAPDPYGMSGGAIFSMAISPMYLTEGSKPLMRVARNVVLAGIATHWRRNKRLIEGATIDKALALMVGT